MNVSIAERVAFEIPSTWLLVKNVYFLPVCLIFKVVVLSIKPNLAFVLAKRQIILGWLLVLEIGGKDGRG